MNTIRSSHDCPELDPQQFLYGVKGIKTHILFDDSSGPDDLEVCLSEILQACLQRNCLPIVSRKGVAYPLPDLSLREIGQLAKIFQEVSVAGGEHFIVDPYINVQSSVLSVRTDTDCDGAPIESAEECWRRVLSILRFRARHRLYGLVQGNVLSVPLHDTDSDILDGHLEAAIGVADCYRAEAFLQDVHLQRMIAEAHATIVQNSTVRRPFQAIRTAKF